MQWIYWKPNNNAHNRLFTNAVRLTAVAAAVAIATTTATAAIITNVEIQYVSRIFVNTNNICDCTAILLIMVYSFASCIIVELLWMESARGREEATHPMNTHRARCVCMELVLYIWMRLYKLSKSTNLCTDDAIV